MPPPPAPVPVAGSASFGVAGGLATKKARYFAPGQTVVLRGRARPFVAGQVVTLQVVRKGKQSKRVRRDGPRRAAGSRSASRSATRASSGSS